MTLLNQIAVETQELRKHGGHPERLYLTKDDAIRLQYELISEGGDRAQQIIHIHPLWGGTEIGLDGSGQCLVRIVERRNEKRTSFTLTPGESSAPSHLN